ncbi:hypothetical protein HU200_005372 [Digitaria exilis]|uniref:Uncharacterized protein n=1 Tax=Digitaria exilis TaxID=1010633 RepID=A0A835FRQ7_9POAL|nr:hypothetical protein HU200_005372 [Digitaria exilis]
MTPPPPPPPLDLAALAITHQCSSHSPLVVPHRLPDDAFSAQPSARLPSPSSSWLQPRPLIFPDDHPRWLVEPVIRQCGHCEAGRAPTPAREGNYQGKIPNSPGEERRGEERIRTRTLRALRPTRPCTSSTHTNSPAGPPTGVPLAFHFRDRSLPPRGRAERTSPDPAREPPPPMEISAAAAAAAARPLLLRPLASSSPHPATSSSATVRRRPAPTSSATATVRRRARTRPRTGRSKPPADAGGGDDGIGFGGSGGGGGGGGRWSWNNGFGSGSGSGSGGHGDWEPDVPAPRRSAAEAALGVVYELMCLLALSNCTQFALRRIAGLLAARVAALRFVPTEVGDLGDQDRRCLFIGPRFQR